MVFSDEIDISLRPSKSTEQTQLDALRDVNVQIFHRHMTCLAKPNLVTLNLFKCLPDLWKAPDFSFGMPGRRIESYEVLPAIQRNPRVQVIFVSFWSFWPRHEKLKQLLVCSKHPNTLGNIGNTVKILVATKSTRENVRQ